MGALLLLAGQALTVSDDSSAGHSAEKEEERDARCQMAGRHGGRFCLSVAGGVARPCRSERGLRPLRALFHLRCWVGF